jgi:cytoskeletal protein RodZ
MTELGRRLREAREARGLTPAELEAATKVRQKFILALESGQFDDLPPAIYIRGQLRTLAAFLGLDPGELIALYEQEGPAAVPLSAPEILAQPLVPLRRFDPELLVGIVLLAAVVGVLGWVFRAYIQPLAEATPTPTATMTLEATATPTDTPLPTATDTPPPPSVTPRPTDTPSMTPSPTPATGAILLTVTITDTSWVRILADGDQVFQGTLSAGQSQTWGARQAIAIRAGNAGGVKVMINGVEQPALGPRGLVVDRAWVLSPDGSIVSLAPPPIGTATPTPTR